MYTSNYNRYTTMCWKLVYMFNLFTMGQADQIIIEADVIQASVTCDF
jgi:hypothetical protein